MEAGDAGLDGHRMHALGELIASRGDNLVREGNELCPPLHIGGAIFEYEANDDRGIPGREIIIEVR